MPLGGKISALGYSVYPNPITESTTVSYFIPEKSDVNFELYNMIGEKIYSFARGAQDIGHYEFNLNLNDIGLQAGVYIMQLKTKNNTAAIRLVQFTEQ